MTDTLDTMTAAAVVERQKLQRRAQAAATVQAAGPVS